MAEGNLHRGHRQRLRTRFINEGLDHFEQHNILELLLFYAIPQKDTNELAHRLLNRFGTISDVFSASVEELTAVPGIGQHTAILISSVAQIADCYLKDKIESRKIVGLSNIAKFCAGCYKDVTTQRLLLVCADNTQTLLNYHVVAEGPVDASGVDLRKIIHIILGSNATAAVLAINRTKGNANPTRTDRELARAVAKSLRPINVRLLDFVIVRSAEQYSSMADIPNCQIYLRGI